MPALYSVKGHRGGGGAGKGRSVVPSGPDFTLYNMSTPLLQIHQDCSASTPEVEPCQCSAVLLELGYKVTDQSNRFVRCGLCLAFEFNPASLLRGFTVSLSFYNISGFCVSVLYWHGRVPLCDFEYSFTTTPAGKSKRMSEKYFFLSHCPFTLSCFLPFNHKIASVCLQIYRFVKL